MKTCNPIGTTMEIKDKFDLDKNGNLVDATKYQSMIGVLMYLTSSRLYIVHATCLYARYQAQLTEKHLKEVKRIFRYLRGLSIWVSGIRRTLAKTGELVLEETRLYNTVYRESRICVSIRLWCSSPLDANTVNELWLSLS
ncbi:hypothetical protein Tco_1394188 [Tanacetum coccineum]